MNSEWKDALKKRLDDNYDSLAAATIVWNYIGELIFNLLVLVGCIKMSDRLIRELMGLG